MLYQSQSRYKGAERHFHGRRPFINLASVERNACTLARPWSGPAGVHTVCALGCCAVRRACAKGRNCSVLARSRLAVGVRRFAFALAFGSAFCEGDKCVLKILMSSPDVLWGTHVPAETKTDGQVPSVWLGKFRAEACITPRAMVLGDRAGFGWRIVVPSLRGFEGRDGRPAVRASGLPACALAVVAWSAIAGCVWMEDGTALIDGMLLLRLRRRKRNGGAN